MLDKPIQVSYCGVPQSGGTGYVKIELLINGTPVPGRTFIRGHPLNVADQFTVSGAVKVLLNDGDIISVRVTPIRVSNYKQYTYAARGNQCSLTVQKLRHFQ